MRTTRTLPKTTQAKRRLYGAVLTSGLTTVEHVIPSEARDLLLDQIDAPVTADSSPLDAARNDKQSFDKQLRLDPAVLVVEPDDVVFADVGAALHLDQD